MKILVLLPCLEIWNVLSENAVSSLEKLYDQVLIFKPVKWLVFKDMHALKRFTGPWGTKYVLFCYIHKTK